MVAISGPLKNRIDKLHVEIRNINKIALEISEGVIRYVKINAIIN